MRPRIAPLALVALLAAGCTMAGSGKSSKPTWKTFVIEHPVLSAPRTLRDGPVELRIHAVVVEEQRTAFGPSSFLAVLKGEVVNLGAAPLFPEALNDDFEFRSRSGTERRGSFFMWGNAGWRRQERTKEPTQLPPGAAGGIRVQAEIGREETRDDPVAVTFAGQTIELR